MEEDRCEMKKVSRVGDKVGVRGVVSGRPGPCLNTTMTVSTVQCLYTDNKKQVNCIFPFIGDNPGQRTGGGVNDECRRTKRGRSWCATKLTRDNRVVGASDQSRDISCGQLKNKNNRPYCAGSDATSQTQRPATQTTKTTSRPKVDDGVTDAELLEFTEKLLNIDTDDVADLITIDTGCSTR